MKLITLFVLSAFTTLATAQKAPIKLVWGSNDTLTYSVDLGSVQPSEIEIKNADLLDSAQRQKIELEFRHKVDSLIKKIETYPLELLLLSSNLKVELQMNGMPIFRTSINSNGEFTDEVAPNHKNLSPLFLSLPEKEVEVGDTWASNLDFNLNFGDQVEVLDKERFDQVLFEKVEVFEGDSIATITTLVSEYIKLEKSSAPDVPSTIRATFSSTKKFNLSKGFLIEVRGLISVMADETTPIMTTRVSAVIK